MLCAIQSMTQKCRSSHSFLKADHTFCSINTFLYSVLKACFLLLKENYLIVLYLTKILINKDFKEKRGCLVMKYKTYTLLKQVKMLQIWTFIAKYLSILTSSK